MGLAELAMIKRYLPEALGNITRRMDISLAFYRVTLTHIQLCQSEHLLQLLFLVAKTLL